MDDTEFSFLGTMGLGRPNAPPKAGAGAPKADLLNEGEEEMLADEGVGRELA